ncbi:hypothetical protein Hanom_Chr01g00062171 [Helianthus anomalus]
MNGDGVVAGSRNRDDGWVSQGCRLRFRLSYDKRCDDESVKVDNRRRPSAITNSLLGFLFSQVYCLMNAGFVYTTGFGHVCLNNFST